MTVAGLEQQRPGWRRPGTWSARKTEREELTEGQGGGKMVARCRRRLALSRGRLVQSSLAAAEPEH